MDQELLVGANATCDGERRGVRIGRGNIRYSPEVGHWPAPVRHIHQRPPGIVSSTVYLFADDSDTSIQPYLQ